MPVLQPVLVFSFNLGEMLTVIPSQCTQDIRLTDVLYFY